MFQSRNILCLDWDKRSLRIVSAKVGRGRMQLEDAHAHRIPEEVDADDPEKMGRYIAQMLELHGLRHKRVVFDVPRDRAVINQLKLPPTPLDELAAAVRFQAQRELPFALDEAEIDYVILETNEQKHATEVLLAAVRLDTLRSMQDTCRAAGLSPFRIGLRPYANLISINHIPGMHDQRVLFLDVGPSMTEIDVIHGDALVFSRSANVGVPFHSGELIGDDSRISSKAELTKIDLVDTAEAEVVDELLVEVTRTLQAYRATEPDPTIDQIVIGGGTGLEHVLLSALDERFGLPTTLFDPTIPLDVPEHEATKLRAFASTIGLAWGMSKSGLLELDFLNPKQPIEKHASLKQRLRLAGLAAAIVLVASVGWAISDRIQLHREYEALRTVNKRLNKEYADALAIDNVILGAADWEDAARLSVQSDHLLNLTRCAIAPGKQMLITDYNWRNSGGKITLKISCSSHEVAQYFVKKINDFSLGGAKPYRASLGTWQEAGTIDPRFKGNIDVTVELVGLIAQQDGEKQRDTQRERRVRDQRRGLG